MAWRIYKEGQGKWLRGIMAVLIAIAAYLLVDNLNAFLGRLTADPMLRIPWINWRIDWRWLVDGPLLVGLLFWAVLLYNKPKIVDFLIETENELKNRVTWPTKKEELNASIVVVITVLIMMLFIFGIDQLFNSLKILIYH